MTSWVREKATQLRNWVAPTEEYLDQCTTKEARELVKKTTRELARNKQILGRTKQSLILRENKLLQRGRVPSCRDRELVARDIGRTRTHIKRIDNEIRNTESMILELESATTHATMVSALRSFDQVQRLTGRLNNPRRMMNTTANIARNNLRRSVAQDAYEDCLEETLGYNDGYEEDQDEALASIMDELSAALPRAPRRSVQNEEEEERRREADYLRLQERHSALNRPA